MATEALPSKPASRETVRLASARDLLRWWRKELVALLPQALRDKVLAGGAIFIASANGGWKLLTLKGGKLVGGAELSPSPSGAEPARAPAGRGLRAAPLRSAKAWLLLRGEDVLVRDATLPLAAEDAIGEALTFELDRLTPFPPEKVWFGYRVTGRDEVEGLLTLRLAFALRDQIEPKVASLRALGARVVGIGLLEESPGDEAVMNLLPTDQRDSPLLGWQGATIRVLSALAVALAAAAFLYPVWLKREAVISLMPRVEQARASAAVSSRLANEIETLAKEHNFLLEKKHSQSSMAALVEELSRSLPDNTWVQQLEVKQGAKTREVQLSGESGSSSALVELLEKTGLFANATFKSPLTKGTNPNTERYLLAAELKPRELPAGVEEGAPLPSQSEPPASPPPAQGSAK